MGVREGRSAAGITDRPIQVPPGDAPVGFQNSAGASNLRFHAARSYSFQRGTNGPARPQSSAQRHPPDQPGCACNPGTPRPIKSRSALHEYGGTGANWCRSAATAPVGSGGRGRCAGSLRRRRDGRVRAVRPESCGSPSSGSRGDQATAPQDRRQPPDQGGKDRSVGPIRAWSRVRSVRRSTATS
jgi:hypothetical protein